MSQLNITIFHQLARFIDCSQQTSGKLWIRTAAFIKSFSYKRWVHVKSFLLTMLNPLTQFFSRHKGQKDKQHRELQKHDCSTATEPHWDAQSL